MWKVTYRQCGETKTAKENLSHHEACLLVVQMQGEGFKHVDFVKQ